MSLIGGLNPAGNLQDVSVTHKGEVFTAIHAGNTPLLIIPGIGTAAAYATGDAFGVSFRIDVPKEGTIATVVFHDYDDEGLTKELVLFSRPFTETADNAAFAVSDADLQYCVGVVSIQLFYNYGSNQIGIATPALYYNVPQYALYCQLVTRGADNIAAGAIPTFFMVVV